MIQQWTPPVITADPSVNNDALARELLRYLPGSHAATNNTHPESETWILFCQAGRLGLRQPGGAQLVPDFTQGKIRHRSQQSGHGAGLLARALGLRTYRRRFGHLPAVIDATGGWAQDSWAIASLGCEVQVFEKHPVVYSLVAHALQRALAEPTSQSTAARITLHYQDAMQGLSPIMDNKSVQTTVIYLDPMYPAQRRRGASSKAMQFLHGLLGPSDDQASDRLLCSALSESPSRVVVKRSRLSPPLRPGPINQAQLTVVSSRNTRYDIYHPSSQTVDKQPD